MSFHLEGFGRRFVPKDVRKDLAEQESAFRESRAQNDHFTDSFPEESGEAGFEHLANISHKINFDKLIARYAEDAENRHRNTEHDRGSGFDLINELGYGNQYDLVAAQAQLVGTQYGEPVLVRLGTELADLILHIPYNSDKFYQVIAKSKEVAQRVKEVRDFSYDDFDLSDDDGRIIRFYFHRERLENASSPENTAYQYRILIHTPRTEKFERDVIHTSAVAFMKSYLCFQRRNLACEDYRVGYGYAYGDQQRFFSQDSGRMVYWEEVWRHENNMERGFRDLFVFETYEQASKAWSEMKKSLIKKGYEF